MSGRRTHQRGIALIAGMILLLVAAVLVLSAFALVRTHGDIAINTQRRDEALASAQQTVEAAVNSPLLTTSPTAVFTTPCGSTNTLCYDINGDGTNDVTAALTPTPACVKAASIPQATLDVTKAVDKVCVIEQAQTFGVAGAATGNSLCAGTTWDVRAVATDTNTGASAAVTQGVGVRVRAQDVASSCP